MKKITLFAAFFVVLLGFSSCETQDSLDPRPVIVAGQYVRIETSNRMLSIDHLNETAFVGTLTAPGGNVQEYVLKVRRKNKDGIITGNYIELLRVNSFPYELRITPQMIAEKLGIADTDLQFGDFYQFLAESHGINGTVVNYSNLSATVKTQKGMKQAYRFLTTMSNDNSILQTESNGNVFDIYQAI